MELGFKSDTTKLDDFIKSVGQLDMSSIMATAGLGGLYEMARKVTENTREAGMEMYKYSTITGMSAQQMSSWTKAAEQAGVQGDIVRQTFMDLQAAQAKARIWGLDQNVATGLAMIQNLTKVKITPQDYFGDVAKYQDKVKTSLEGLEASQQRQIMNMLGINEQMLIFYKSAEYSGRNSQDVIGPEAVGRMKELTAEWVRISQRLQMVGATFASEISPALIKTAQAFSAVLRDIEGNSFFRMLGGITGKIGQGLGKISDLVEIGYTYSKVADDFLWRNSLEQRVGVSAPNINATFHFSHVMSPEEIKKHTMYALSDAIRESHNKLPAKGY